MKITSHLCKVFAIAVVSTLTIPPAKADALGLFFGVSGWDAENTGDVQSGSVPVSVDNDLGFESETLAQAYVAFDHFIPLIPNVRLQYVDLDYEGDGQLSKDFDGINFNGNVATQLDLNQTDLIAYWRILDNVVNLDLGVQVSRIDGSLSIRQAGAASNTNFDEILPAGYLSAGVDLPFTGLSLTGGLAVGADVDGGRLNDLRVNLNYEIGVVGADLGWRKLDLMLDDVEGVDNDFTLSGPYLGLTLHF